VLLAVVPVLAGCGSRPAMRSAPSPCDPRTAASLRAWAQAGFSGTVTLTTRGRVDCAVAFGAADRRARVPNTVDTVFSLGSIAKSFTAAAVLDLVDTGKLSLDDRAGDLIPRLSGPAADATVRQLLLHTSGLKGTHGTDHRPLDRDAAIASISRLESAFRPGRDFLYSNAGYTLLALIVEQVSGARFRDYLRSEILTFPDGRVAGGFWDGRPAARGPRAVGYLEDGPTREMGQFGGPHWAIDGNGDIAMTTKSLAQWTWALFDGRLVSKRAAKVLATPGVARGNGQAEAPGWVVFDKEVFGQTVLTSAGGGGDVGHDAIVAWLPAAGRVIAMASNTTGVTAEQLMAAVGPALAAGRPLPMPRGTGDDVDPARLRELAGTYVLPTGGSIKVAAKDRRLVVSASGEDARTRMFGLSGRYGPAEAAAQERAVTGLLSGRSREGRSERAGIEKGFGRITAFSVAGTIVDDGELRTYVDVTAGGRRLLIWYALNEQGGVAAAEGPAQAPAMVFVPAGPGRFRRDAPTGDAPDVLVRIAGRKLTIAGPDGDVTAELAR
jgi:CubicO group peptidase (beta-lactamase class C family)